MARTETDPAGDAGMRATGRVVLIARPELGLRHAENRRQRQDKTQGQLQPRAMLWSSPGQEERNKKNEATELAPIAGSAAVAVLF